MRINKIEFVNFMPYFGCQTLDLSVTDAAPLILIHGENAHGKTSIQHAVRWCLYGSTKELQSQVRIPERKLLNWKAERIFRADLANDSHSSEVFFSVRMEFSHNGHEYELERQHAFTGQNFAEKKSCTLRIDGNNPIPESLLQESIEGLLSEDLSHFFLFDGEVLDRFESMRNNDDTSKFVRQQIERTLSIPRLRLASKSLDDAIEKEQKSQRSLVKKTEKNHDALKKIEEKEELFQSYRKEEDTLRRRLTQNQETIDQIESNLRNITKTAEEIERRKSLRAEIKGLDEQCLVHELEIKSLSKNAFWAPLFYKLQEAAQVTKDLSPQIESHKSQIESDENLLKSLHSLIETNICPVCSIEHREVPGAVQRKITETKEALESQKSALSTLLKDFSPESKELLEKIGFSETSYSQLRDSRKKLMHVKAEATLKRNTLKSLEVSNSEINEKEDSGMIQRYRTLSSEIANDTKDLENAGNAVSKLRAEIESLNSSLFQSSLIDLTDKKNRIVILQYLRELIELSILKYSEMVRVEVELQASSVFKHIISEKDFTGLSINESFGMDIQRADGGRVDIRSEGTAHIVALSLVAGLIKTAINDGFVLMDTPFGRLDNTHRGNICTWATIANLQIALFMHSGEFDEKAHLAIFGNKIGRRYRIDRINSEESKFVVVGRA